jgi:hypothetical protein
MFEQPLARLWFVATPTDTPHTDGELLIRLGPARVTSWKRRCTLAEAWMVDGDSGRLQDGEGWTPQEIHQSILFRHTIYYRPLASEELFASSH